MNVSEEVIKQANGLSVEAFGATILYSVVGIVLLMISVMLLNGVFKLNIRHELVKDNNIAVGILIGSMAISIAIIISGTISS